MRCYATAKQPERQYSIKRANVLKERLLEAYCVIILFYKMTNPEDNLKILDFLKICRICLTESNNLQFFFTSRVMEVFRECSSVEAIPNDGLPQNLCNTCFSTLESFYNFKEKIQASARILQNYMNDTAGNSKEVMKNIKKPITNTEIEKALNDVFGKPAQNILKSEEDDKCVCQVCNKEFSCKRQLTRHQKTHVGIRSHICEVCGKAYVESGSLRKHFLSKHSGREKPHKCSQCNQRFDLRSTLIRHIRIHTGEKPYGCDICLKFYPSKSYLSKHRKSHFEKRSKPFICEVCSKSFSLKDGLKAHLITHTNHRPYRCTMCDKSFSMKGSLQSHIKYVHTKQKDFMCQVCAKVFVTNFELKEHLRKHSGEKKECKYQCKLCDKNLSSSAHLKLHVRSEHTGERPYQCEICMKAFFTGQALKIHKRYHTGEKPYSCGFCGKAFVTNERVKVHERIHTGERPYTCTLCNSAFSQSSTFKTHMKCH